MMSHGIFPSPFFSAEAAVEATEGRHLSRKNERPLDYFPQDYEMTHLGF